MAGATPLYEFESRSFEHSTSELPKLEALAEKLRAGCTAHSLFGMHEYRLDARPGGTILDQAHEDDRDFAEGVLVSAGIEDPGSVDTIFANIITGAGNYNSYLRVNADTAVGNFHADPRIITQDGQVLFLPPRAGRLAIALFDDGIFLGLLPSPPRFLLLGVEAHELALAVPVQQVVVALLVLVRDAADFAVDGGEVESVSAHLCELVGHLLQSHAPDHEVGQQDAVCADLVHGAASGVLVARDPGSLLVVARAFGPFVGSGLR